MAIARDTRALYVTNRLAGTLSVIDMAAFGMAQTWIIGGSPDMVQVSPDGQQIWISSRNHGHVSGGGQQQRRGHCTSYGRAPRRTA